MGRIKNALIFGAQALALFAYLAGLAIAVAIFCIWFDGVIRMTKAQMMEVVCKSVPMDALAKQEMLKQSKDYVSGYYNAVQAITLMNNRKDD